MDDEYYKNALTEMLGEEESDESGEESREAGVFVYILIIKLVMGYDLFVWHRFPLFSANFIRTKAVEEHVFTTVVGYAFLNELRNTAVIRGKLYQIGNGLRSVCLT